MVRVLKERSQIMARLPELCFLVSLYSSQQGVVLASQQFESKHDSELKVVQTMLEEFRRSGVHSMPYTAKKLLSFIVAAATTLSPSKVTNLDY